MRQCPPGTDRTHFLPIAGVVCGLGLIAALVIAYRQRGWRRLLVACVGLVGSVVVGSVVAFFAGGRRCVPLSYEPAAVCAELRAFDEAFHQSADLAPRGALGASVDCEGDCGRARDELGFFEYRELVSCVLQRLAPDSSLDALPMLCPGVRGLRRHPP